MAIYFITTSTKDRYPYFENDFLCEFFVSYLEFIKAIFPYQLYTFCVLYDHIHLLIDFKGSNINKFIQNFKKGFSRDANYIIEGTEIPESRFPALYNKILFDNYMNSNSIKLINRYFTRLSQLRFEFSRLDKQLILSIPKFQWNKSFHDHRIRGSRDFENHYKYTIYNHLHHTDHGYSHNYRYTSLNYPDLIDRGMMIKP